MTATEISLNKLRTHEKVFAAGRVMQYIWGGRADTYKPNPCETHAIPLYTKTELNEMCIYYVHI